MVLATGDSQALRGQSRAAGLQSSTLLRFDRLLRARGTLRSPSIFPQEAAAQMCAEAAEPLPGRPPEQLWVLPKHRGTIYPMAQVAAWLFLFTWGGFAAVAVVGSV